MNSLTGNSIRNWLKLVETGFRERRFNSDTRNLISKSTSLAYRETYLFYTKYFEVKLKSKLYTNLSKINFFCMSIPSFAGRIEKFQ